MSFKVGELVVFIDGMAGKALYRVHQIIGPMADLREFGKEGLSVRSVQKRLLRKATDEEIAARVLHRLKRPMNFFVECPECLGKGLVGPNLSTCMGCAGTGEIGPLVSSP